MSHTTEADDLSFKLLNLTEIVKLAAFAAEARRTLTAMHSLACALPDMGDTVRQCVNSPRAWMDREDNAGQVLLYVADELESARRAFEESRDALALAASPRPSDKMGGAA